MSRRSTLPRVLAVLLTAWFLAACSSAAGPDGNDGGLGRTDASVDGGPDAGPGGTDGGPTLPDGGPLVDPTGGDQYGSGPDPVSDPTGNPTTEDLIDAGLAAGTLAMDQALLYKLYADFGDPRLPAQYRGDDTGRIEGSAASQVKDYVDSVGFENIPTETATAFRRFFAPPYIQGSWWNQQHPDEPPAATAGSSPGARIATTAAPNPNCHFWEQLNNCPFNASWLVARGTTVNVWYLNDALAPLGARQSALLVAEFDGAIAPILTAVMGRGPLTEPDKAGRLDVILLDLPKDVEGRTEPTTLIVAGQGRQKMVSTRIYLSRALPSRGLIAQAAHEYMHAIQRAYDVAAKNSMEYLALSEPTAVWATQYVFPLNNWEQKYAKSYLSRMEYALDHKPVPGDKVFSENFSYGAYLFPLFLQTKNNATIIRELWEATVGLTEDLVIYDSVLKKHSSTFEKTWKQFARAAWNQENLNFFDKLDQLKDAPGTVSGVTEDYTLSMGGAGFVRHELFWDAAHLPTTNPAGLPRASVRYYHVTLNDSAARNLLVLNGVSFKLEAQAGPFNGLTPRGLPPPERHGASIQVYLKVNGAWQSDAIDLTNRPWVAVCRDDPTNHVEEMVLIVSNGETVRSAPNYGSLDPRGKPPQVLATDIGCRDWTGTANLATAASMDGSSETLVMGLATFKNMSPSRPILPGSDPADYPTSAAGSDQFPIDLGNIYNVSGVANWTYQPPPGCYGSNSKQLTVGPLITGVELTNWTFDNPAIERGILIASLFGTPTLGTPTMELPRISSSPECAREPPTTTVSLGIDIRISLRNSAVRVSPGGLTITSPASEVTPSRASGSWSMQGSTQ